MVSNGSSVVGINYGVVEQGMQRYKNLKMQMESLIGQMRSLKTSHPDEWTGKDEERLVEILHDAERKMGLMEDNIKNLSNFINITGAAHVSSENSAIKTLTQSYNI